MSQAWLNMHAAALQTYAMQALNGCVTPTKNHQKVVEGSCQFRK